MQLEDVKLVPKDLAGGFEVFVSGELEILSLKQVAKPVSGTMQHLMDGANTYRRDMKFCYNRNWYIQQCMTPHYTAPQTYDCRVNSENAT